MGLLFGAGRELTPPFFFFVSASWLFFFLTQVYEMRVMGSTCLLSLLVVFPLTHTHTRLNKHQGEKQGYVVCGGTITQTIKISHSCMHTHTHEKQVLDVCRDIIKSY